jgi:hypothetical protein
MSDRRYSVTDSDGTVRNYKGHYFHRENGPAVEWSNGDKSYYMNGKLHREDGPAIDWADEKAYYYKGERTECTSQQEFERLLRLKAFW